MEPNSLVFHSVTSFLCRQDKKHLEIFLLSSLLPRSPTPSKLFQWHLLYYACVFDIYELSLLWTALESERSTHSSSECIFCYHISDPDVESKQLKLAFSYQRTHPKGTSSSMPVTKLMRGPLSSKLQSVSSCAHATKTCAFSSFSACCPEVLIHTWDGGHSKQPWGSARTDFTTQYNIKTT